MGAIQSTHYRYRFGTEVLPNTSAKHSRCPWWHCVFISGLWPRTRSEEFTWRTQPSSGAGRPPNIRPSTKRGKKTCQRSLITGSQPLPAAPEWAPPVAVYKVIRTVVHEVVSFSVYEVARFHTGVNLSQYQLPGMRTDWPDPW